MIAPYGWNPLSLLDSLMTALRTADPQAVNTRSSSRRPNGGVIRSDLTSLSLLARTVISSSKGPCLHRL